MTKYTIKILDGKGKELIKYSTEDYKAALNFLEISKYHLNANEKIKMIITFNKGAKSLFFL